MNDECEVLVHSSQRPISAKMILIFCHFTLLAIPDFGMPTMGYSAETKHAHFVGESWV